MRIQGRTLSGLVLLLTLVTGSLEARERKLLNRSVYMPVVFELCEHLDAAVYYENDRPVSTMPAERIFQFTYYPELERLLPESVRVRVEGSYVEDGEPFVAKLAVAVDGIHTARSVKRINTEEQLEKQLHKRDARLESRTFLLACKRFCKREAPAAGQQDRVGR